MTIFISFFVCFTSLICGIFEVIPRPIAAILFSISLILILVCIFSKPKYKERELLCWCELLPIVDGIYAIKTVKNKYLCKYIDNEDENKIKIDVVKVKTDILTMTEGEKPMLYMFETKAKNAWLLTNDYTMYNVVLSIPENSVLNE